MNGSPENAINLASIAAALQASFENHAYTFLKAGFPDGADPDAEMAAWRAEMDETWAHLAVHTAEVWDLAWGHTLDPPDSVRADWLFRRRQSPFRNCWVEDCRQVIADLIAASPPKPAQFYTFMLAVLAEGSGLLPWSECKPEAGLTRPEKPRL